MSAALKVGDLLDVTIRARVVDVSLPCLVVETDCMDATVFDLEDPAIEVARVAPVEWPPVPGDLWRDGHGEVWFTYLVPAGEDLTPELFMCAAATGLQWCASHERQIKDNGPWELVHREPVEDTQAGAS